MVGVSADRPPTTGQLKRLLFDTKRRRRWFINAQIRAGRLSPDPLKLAEQHPELGPVMVFAAPPYLGAPRQDWYIGWEAALVSASEIDAKREAAYDWIKAVSARGILALVIVYTLGSDGDFATMEKLKPPWMPETIEPGDRIRYKGIAHAEPGARGISLNVDGVFEITDIVLGLGWSDELWWEIHDLRFGDHLYLSEALLTAATFLNAEPSSGSVRLDQAPVIRSAKSPEKAVRTAKLPVRP